MCYGGSLLRPSGNAAILKGGKESNETTRLLSQAIQNALSKTAISSSYIQTIQTRAEVSALLALKYRRHIQRPRWKGSGCRCDQRRNQSR